jgi:hypothetical protein
VSTPQGIQDPNKATTKPLSKPAALFSKEEEKWLEKQFDLIDSAYNSVPLGVNVIKTFFLIVTDQESEYAIPILV